MNKIGIPHPSELHTESADIESEWIKMPLVFSDKELWKTDDKVSLVRLRLYIYQYLKKNNCLKHTFTPNETLKVLDEDMEQISYTNLIKLVQSHLYDS
jgi:hypothetical protein